MYSTIQSHIQILFSDKFNIQTYTHDESLNPFIGFLGARVKDNIAEDMDTVHNIQMGKV